ncbi:zinc finger MYM-type protein 1-like protein, partial [Tanacetum coccineum]
MHQVRTSKERLQDMRTGGWEPLIQNVTLFCEKFDCELIGMNGACFDGISRRIGSKVNNLHHYQVGVFYSVIDMQLQELNRHKEFATLKDIKDLCKKMVETKKNEIYPNVYLLIKLVLILPIATSIVERAFSEMKLIKSDLRNNLRDDFMHDCLVSYVEKDILEGISNDIIIARFQAIKPRKTQVKLKLMSTFKGVALNGSIATGGYGQCAAIYVAKVELASVEVGDGLWQDIHGVDRAVLLRALRLLENKGILAIFKGTSVRLDVKRASTESIYVTVWASLHLPLHMGKTITVSTMMADHFGNGLQVATKSNVDVSTMANNELPFEIPLHILFPRPSSPAKEDEHSGCQNVMQPIPENAASDQPCHPMLEDYSHVMSSLMPSNNAFVNDVHQQSSRM